MGWAKDFPAANCVRALLGRTEEEAEQAVCQLACNLDDMTPEALGFAQERLWEAGALDVYTTSIGMKKIPAGRPAHLPVPAGGRGNMTDLLFRHTSTLGVRRLGLTRSVLPRRFQTVSTPWGPVTVKVASDGRYKAEYEEAAAIARRKTCRLKRFRKPSGRRGTMRRIRRNHGAAPDP